MLESFNSIFGGDSSVPICEAKAQESGLPEVPGSLMGEHPGSFLTLSLPCRQTWKTMGLQGLGRARSGLGIWSPEASCAIFRRGGSPPWKGKACCVRESPVNRSPPPRPRWQGANEVLTQGWGREELSGRKSRSEDLSPASKVLR